MKLPKGITKLVGRKVLTLQKHSPTILFAAGVVGVIGSAVLASRATLKLDEVLNETEAKLEKRERARVVEGYTEVDYHQDGVVIYTQAALKVARLYGPAIIAGGLGVAALTGSHIILNRRNGALMIAYAGLERGFKLYRERVAKELGPDKDREFLWDMEDRTIVQEGPNGPETVVIKQPGGTSASPYTFIFDQCNQNWSHDRGYNQMFLSSQQQYANDLLRARGHVFLNDVLDSLGIDRTREGAILGWIKGNGDDYIDFGVFEGDRHSGMRFVKGEENSVWLEFNCDGIIYNKI